MDFYLGLAQVIGVHTLLGLSARCVLHTGQVSIAQGGFFAIGAYTAGMLTSMFSWPLGLALAGGSVLAGAVAVAVGFIALAGVAAETGVVMLIYLDHAWETIKAQRAAEGARPTVADLYAAIMEGAVERVRPKMMTVVAIMAGLLPIMWGSGTGSEVMRRIAAPMVGGMISSTILTLIVIPAIYTLVKERGLLGSEARST